MLKTKSKLNTEEQNALRRVLLYRSMTKRNTWSQAVDMFRKLTHKNLTIEEMKQEVALFEATFLTNFCADVFNVER